MEHLTFVSKSLSAVQMWWDHRQQHALNRERGVEKAKATRLGKEKSKRKKMTLCLYKRANFADVLKCLRYQEIRKMINRLIFKYVLSFKKCTVGSVG